MSNDHEFRLRQGRCYAMLCTDGISSPVFWIRYRPTQEALTMTSTISQTKYSGARNFAAAAAAAAAGGYRRGRESSRPSYLYPLHRLLWRTAISLIDYAQSKQRYLRISRWRLAIHTDLQSCSLDTHINCMPIGPRNHSNSPHHPMAIHVRNQC